MTSGEERRDIGGLPFENKPQKFYNSEGEKE